MDTYSTQAVEADTTLNATPVKRWKRGDAREDGMVFWCYQKGKERWVSKPEFAELSRKEKEYRAANKQAATERMRRWRASNPDKNREAYERNYKKNKEKILAQSRAWAKGNPEKVRQKSRKYAEANKATIAARMRRWRAKGANAVAHRLRNRINSAFRAKRFKKNTKTAAMLGCTFEEFKTFLEAKFLPGMSWDNRPDWHIDHIVPCEAADDGSEMEKLFHYTNLRPMWGPENIAKSDTLPEEHELPADLHDEVRKIWQRAKDSACTK